MIKGYLSHGHSMLVLSKQGPFPRSVARAPDPSPGRGHAMLMRPRSFGKYNEKESAAVKNEIKDERF